MEGSWWKKRSDLDAQQAAFYSLPLDGSYLLTGPPGSGKTNLLLLRATYLHGANLKNVLFLIVGTVLRDFIQTGLGGRQLPADRIMSFREWAHAHALKHAPKSHFNVDWNADYRENRSQIIRMLKEANEAADDPNLYDAIFVDEAQDLTLDELKILRALTSRLHLSGDQRQSLFNGSQLKNLDKELVLQPYVLTNHYRVGKEICSLADRVYVPKGPGLGLLHNSQYPEQTMESSVVKYRTATQEEQYRAMCENIALQLKAYPKEGIGILIPRWDLLEGLIEYLQGTRLSESFLVHRSSARGVFAIDKRVHILTIHGAKGTEFRAVHIVGAELLTGFFGSKELFYTAVTRAKTSLSIYYTGTLEPFIDSALSQLRIPDESEIFPGEDKLS